MYLDKNDCIQFTPFDTVLCLLDEQMDALERLLQTIGEARELIDLLDARLSPPKWG